jgi:hypothetical protein
MEQVTRSLLNNAEGEVHYHTMTGRLNWAIVALGRHDVQHVVSALSAECDNKNVAPRNLLEQCMDFHNVGVNIAPLTMMAAPLVACRDCAFWRDSKTKDDCSFSPLLKEHPLKKSMSKLELNVWWPSQSQTNKMIVQVFSRLLWIPSS